MTIFALAVFWLIMAATADILARRKYRSGWAWGLTCLFLGPLFILPLLACPPLAPPAPPRRRDAPRLDQAAAWPKQAPMSPADRDRRAAPADRPRPANGSERNQAPRA